MGSAGGRTKARRALIAMALVVAAVTGCSSPDAPRPASAPTGTYRPVVSGPATISVPDTAPTVQAAVDSARPGDLIVIRPGRYHEAVQVRTPRIVIRGLERNRTVLDGRFQLRTGILVTAPGVAVENMTVTGYRLNGLLFTGVTDSGGAGQASRGDDYLTFDTTRFPMLDGYRATSVTAYNNGLYGIYAFDAKNGLIERTYTSGHPDSGIYVGQCKPCTTVVRDNVATGNAIGYEGTNASGGLYVVGNRFVANRIGATQNSQNSEGYAPQSDAVIAGNLIASNANPRTPETAEGGFGVGLAISGGRSNQVTGNRVERHPVGGVVVTTLENFAPIGNQVTGNVLDGNRIDLAFTVSSRRTDEPPSGNCWSGNRAARGRGQPMTVPGALQRGSCDPPSSGSSAGPADGGDPAPASALAGGPPAPPGLSYKECPPPPDQPSMAEAASAPPVPVTGPPPTPGVTELRIPDRAPGPVS
ncbi:MAG: right-handed parallel beta-helix repeat-containing protein [Angustibacter sp.]